MGKRIRRRNVVVMGVRNINNNSGNINCMLAKYNSFDKHLMLIYPLEDLAKLSSSILHCISLQMQTDIG